MIRPTLEQARALAGKHSLVPIALEVFSDMTSSMRVLKNLSARGTNFYLLESVVTGDTWGRYSFLGCDPEAVLRCRDGKVTVESGGVTKELTGPPLKVLRSALKGHTSPSVDGLPPFTGGYVGYFAYDFVRYIEPHLDLSGKNEEAFDDFYLLRMDKVIAFDHFRQKIILICNIATDRLEENYIKGVSALKDLESLVLGRTLVGDDLKPGQCGEFTQLFTKEEYCAVVRKMQYHIKEGDIFQAVPSNRFCAPFTGDLLYTYRVLRTVNPSPYMVYMNLADTEVTSTSPETLVSLRDGVVCTYPLAGTRRRGKTAEEDALLEEELLSDGKELAEHDMLVDLGRNDLGKVSEFGSVKVEEYRQIKRFSHVMHLSSKVSGKIAAGRDALDALAATLPAGTLSGAPKRRAIELIDEAEGCKRGLYGGALGYIAFTGNMDMCIGIRMAVRKNGKVFVQAGGGVVADSVPENEYEETRSKARAIIKALAGEE